MVVSLSCADVPVHPLEPPGQESGIALGLASFATLAAGTIIHSPRCSRRAERRLKAAPRRAAPRRVSRRKKGSHRRKKAVKWLAKAHHNVKRQRLDFQHKPALALLRLTDTLYHEALQTANLVTNHRLAKRISDAGWGHCLTILSHKAAGAGRSGVAVPPA